MKKAITLILTVFMLADTGLGLATDIQPGLLMSPQVPGMAANFENLELVWQMGEGGSAESVAVQGGYVYIGLGPLLVVVDISTPTNPRQVGSLWMPDFVRDIVVADEYVYVAADEGGLLIVDASDPAHPTETGFYEMSTWRAATRIAVSGNYVYLVDEYDSTLASLQVLDVSDPAHPTALGSYSPGQDRGGIRDVLVAGNYAYVVTELEDQFSFFSSLCIVDISQPANPTEIGYHDVAGSTRRVAVSGNYAYLGGEKLWVVDISDSSNPTEASSHWITGHLFDLAVSSGHLYVLAQFLDVFNISDPTNPIFLGSSDNTGVDIVVIGGYAYFASRGDGLRVVDISDPTVPNQVGMYNTPGNVSHVALGGNHAYAVTEDGFWVVDLSDPTSPAEVSLNDMINLAPFMNTLELVGSYAYLQAGDDLQVLDVSDPVSPTEVALYETAGSSTLGASIAGDYAYLSKGNGLLVLDISDPADPAEAGFYASSYGFGQVVVSGGYAYALEGGGLSVLDVSDPISPTEVGSYEAAFPFQKVAVEGGYAYVVDWYGTLRVLDISNEANPTEVTSCEIVYGIPAPIKDVVVAGHYLYVAIGDSGLQVLNISNPTNPTEAGFYDTPGNAQSAAVADGDIYVADGYGGLIALRFSANNAISGRVSHSNNLPFSGAHISANIHLTATTDATGAYIYTDLPYGMYTLTPTLTNHTFWPPTRTVTVPPSASNQNFTILPCPISATLTSGASNMLVFTDTQGLPTRLDFPIGAVAQTTTLVLTPTIATRANFAFTGHAFKLTAYQEGDVQPDFTFSIPVTVTFYYSDTDVRLVSDERKLALCQRTENEWQDAAQSCDPAAIYIRDLESNILSIPICHLSHFALFGPTNRLHLPLIRR